MKASSKGKLRKHTCKHNPGNRKSLPVETSYSNYNVFTDDELNIRRNAYVMN